MYIIKNAQTGQYLKSYNVLTKGDTSEHISYPMFIDNFEEKWPVEFDAQEEAAHIASLLKKKYYDDFIVEPYCVFGRTDKKEGVFIIKQLKDDQYTGLWLSTRILRDRNGVAIAETVEASSTKAPIEYTSGEEVNSIVDMMNRYGHPKGFSYQACEVVE